MLTRLLLAMLGGALGSGARFLVGSWAVAKLPEGFPYGTWIVNVVGSFVMGALSHYVSTTEAITPNARVFIAVGILGGFTTYSSFNQESLNLVNHHAWGMAAFYMGLTLTSCLLAGIGGIYTARWMTGG